MRTAPRILYPFAILLLLISVLVDLSAAAAQSSLPGFVAAWPLPAILAWLQDQVPAMSWFRLSTQLEAVAPREDATPRLTLTLPAGTTVTTTGGRMVFAQMADGQIGGGKFYRTPPATRSPHEAAKAERLRRGLPYSDSLRRTV